jgi:hypothetical protein
MAAPDSSAHRQLTFDFRLSRQFWGIDDLDVAFRLHAVMGGTPGYRDLTDDPPQTLTELDRWLQSSVLNPAHALFDTSGRCWPATVTMSRTLGCCSSQGPASPPSWSTPPAPRVTSS